MTSLTPRAQIFLPIILAPALNSLLLSAMGLLFSPFAGGNDYFVKSYPVVITYIHWLTALAVILWLNVYSARRIKKLYTLKSKVVSIMLLVLSSLIIFWTYLWTASFGV